MKKIILIGSGGHAKSCIDIIEKENKFKIVCLVDKFKKNSRLFNYPIVDEKIPIENLLKKAKNALIAVGQIKNADTRVKLFQKYKKLGFKFPVIISPNAIVSNYSEIDEGSIIMHQTIINASSRIGSNCIINNKSLVEHDVVIGNHCHISTSVKVNGNATIGNRVFIGSNSVIVNSKKIKSNTFIPAMSLIK